MNINDISESLNGTPRKITLTILVHPWKKHLFDNMSKALGERWLIGK